MYLMPPLNAFPLELGIDAGVRKKLEWWGYQMVEKSFKIGLAILIQYQRVMDTQPRCRSIYRAYYVTCVKMSKTNVLHHELVTGI